jgi:hypothetical protein
MPPPSWTPHHSVATKCTQKLGCWPSTCLAYAPSDKSLISTKWPDMCPLSATSPSYLNVMTHKPIPRVPPHTQEACVLFYCKLQTQNTKTTAPFYCFTCQTYWPIHSASCGFDNLSYWKVLQLISCNLEASTCFGDKFWNSSVWQWHQSWWSTKRRRFRKKDLRWFDGLECTICHGLSNIRNAWCFGNMHQRHTSPGLGTRILKEYKLIRAVHTVVDLPTAKGVHNGDLFLAIVR